MRLLLDQGLPRRSALLLRERGFDALHTGEIEMAEASDEDFHALLARSGASAPSVIRIRIEGLRAEEMALLIAQVLEAIAEDIARGVVVSVDATHTIRLRRLPL